MVHLIDDDSFVSVLRDTLIFHSGHFAQIFKENPDRRIIEIPDLSTLRFRVIEHWLRTGMIVPTGLRLSFADAVTLYEFGDTYSMPRLRNAVINLVFTMIFQDQIFPISALNDIYTRTHSNCSLRMLLVSIAIAVYSWDDILLKGELVPKQFLLEVLQALRGKTLRLGVIMFPIECWHKAMLESLCNWHEHVEPEQYDCRESEPTKSDAERIDSADCEVTTPHHEDTSEQEENEGWHSVLVMRTR